MNYEKILRKIRAHDALYGDLGEEKEIQAERIRDRCIAKLRTQWAVRVAQVNHEAGQRLLRTFA